MIYLFAVLLMLIVYLSDSYLENKYRRVLPVLLLISVPIFGSPEITMFGLTSNLGNLFFAGMVMALILKVKRYGKFFGFEFIHVAMYAFTLIAIISGFSQFFHDGSLFNTRLIIASIVSFYFVQSAFVYVIDKMRDRWMPVIGILSAIIVMQLFDSLVFFPIAFAGTDIEWMQYAINGFFIKIIFAIISQPLICIRWGSKRNLI